MYLKNYFAVYQPPSELQLTNSQPCVYCRSSRPRATLGAYDNGRGGTRFASWSGSDVRWKSMRNQAESPFTSHSPHRLGISAARFPRLFIHAARTDRTTRSNEGLQPHQVCWSSNRPRSSTDARTCTIYAKNSARAAARCPAAEISGFQLAEIRTRPAIPAGTPPLPVFDACLTLAQR